MTIGVVHSTVASKASKEFKATKAKLDVALTEANVECLVAVLLPNPSRIAAAKKLGFTAALRPQSTLCNKSRDSYKNTLDHNYTIW